MRRIGVALARRTARWAAGPAYVFLLFAGSTTSQGLAGVLVGETTQVRIHGPAPGPASSRPGGAGWTYTLHHPGATFLKLHFSTFRLGRDDTVTILDARNRPLVRYRGAVGGGRGFWAPSVLGDTITIELRASDPESSVTIDRYGHGSAPIVSQSACGTDQREDVACQAGTPIAAASRAVGRMLFEEDGFFVACTGFLISPRDHFLTAGHCLTAGGDLESLEVRFGFEHDSCGGQSVGPSEAFVADRVLGMDKALDAALLVLAGNPSARYGFLALADRDPALDEPLYLPQHAGGEPKTVAVAGCRVSSERADGVSPGSDFGHACDTQPGSSGSPVLDLEDRVVGLHHLGGCFAAGGQNQAVRMSRILDVIPPQVTALELSRARLGLGDGELKVAGVLRLSLTSDGIAPLTQPVALTLADATGVLHTLTVPPGRFRREGAGFIFVDHTGAVAGGLRTLRLKRRPNGDVGVAATVRPVAIGGTDPRDLTITLQVGAESGAATVRLRRKPRALIFP